MNRDLSSFRHFLKVAGSAAGAGVVQLVQSDTRLGPWSAIAVGDDCDLKVLCQADNVLGEIPAA
jgi:hypothetical protein